MHLFGRLDLAQTDGVTLELEAQSAIAPLAARRGLGWNLSQRERETKNDHNQNTTRTRWHALLRLSERGVVVEAQALPQRPSVGRYTINYYAGAHKN